MEKMHLQNVILSIMFLMLFGATGIYAQLTVSSHTPTQYQQNVTAGTDIVVTFSDDIDEATIDANSFNVDGDAIGKIAGVYSTADDQVTFNPTVDFKPGEVVTVTLTTDIESTGEVALNDDYTWQFTVKSAVASGVFTESVISTEAAGAYSVYSADVDGDGDMDVLSASMADDKIAWYKNDGEEIFAEHVISESADWAQSVYAADVDGDGDMDVLSASSEYDKIAWYENDGEESFTEYAISISADYAYCVYAADVDGDGDMDVLSASMADDKIAWYENNGGAESFTEHVISESALSALSVYAADVDGDGDMDVLSASSWDDKIAWYENDGEESFTEYAISISADGAYCVYAADVDGDGDMDVLSASYNDDKIAWYENDGEESFTENVISTSADGAYFVYAADVNGDGDMDVLSASSWDDKIAWYENDGEESFTENVISTSANGAYCVYAADVDGDGDMDALSASYIDNKIAWYENDPTYTLTYTAGANGTISGEKLQTVVHGSDGTAVEAVPASPEYHFVDWSDGSTDNPRTDMNVTADIDVTANFSNTYTLTYTAGANGTITGETLQTVVHGSDGTAVEAVPASPEYHFVDWSDGSTVNPRTDMNVTADIDVTANFEIKTYTLTYTAGLNGTITGETLQTVVHGSDGTAVEAVPASPEYHFVDWSDGSTDNPRTDMNVTADIDVTANFEIKTYTLTYTAGLNGTITGETLQTVVHGNDGTAVEAVPASPEYHFVDWSDGSTVNPRTDMNVTADITVTANFEIKTYTLTYTAGLNGTITGETLQTVVHGSDGTAVEAVPASPEYHFVDWSDGSTDNPRTDMNVTADIDVTANFEIKTYTLTYTAGLNGTITGETLQTVVHGSDGTAVEAVPASPEYHFVDWSDGSTVNPRTDMNVTADIDVTANFEIKTYTLTYTAGLNGTITGETLQTVVHGSDGTAVEAVPASPEYHFVDWSDGSTDNPRTDMNVTADIDVTANFEIKTYTLTYTAGLNGTITGKSPQSIDHGSNGTAVNAVPNTGYRFVDWSDGSTDNPRTDMNVIADITVTANFDIITELNDQSIIEGTSIPKGIVSLPNPVKVENGYVDIIINTGIKLSEVRLLIFDALGNRINEQNSDVNIRGMSRFRWNLRNLNGMPVAPGAYKVVAVAYYRDGSIRKFTSLMGIKR